MKKAALMLVALSALLAGCPTGVPHSERYGSLVLTFSTTEMSKAIIKPSLDMNVASYSISGSGPDSATFSQTEVTGASVAQNALLVGAWTIVVDAFNAAHELIGNGITTVDIKAGPSNTASVAVTPLSGKGTLTVNVSWTTGLILAPSVVASLTPVGGSAKLLTFTTGTDSVSYSSGNTLDVGYYWLNLELQEGGVPDIWGFGGQSVRILKDQTTAATFNLTAQNINTGGLSLTITPDMSNPITISFSGQQSQIALGQDMTVSATTSETGVSYQWYLNGAAISVATNSSITIGSGLGVGNHRLDLGVWKGNVIGSESVEFSVLGIPTEVINTNIAEIGAKLDILFYAGPQFINPLYTIWVEDLDGNFVQDLFVCNAPGTNIYGSVWKARPMSVPYWAHKACNLDPYAGSGTHDSTGMYLALPSTDGGPFPTDLDAVTGATRSVDFRLQTARKNDSPSEIRVLLEINRSRDFNTYYTNPEYEPGGQPSLVYGATIQTNSGEKYYTMSLLGTGHPLGSDGVLHDTSNLTTALDMVKSLIIHVKP